MLPYHSHLLFPTSSLSSSSPTELRNIFFLPGSLHRVTCDVLSATLLHEGHMADRPGFQYAVCLFVCAVAPQNVFRWPHSIYRWVTLHEILYFIPLDSLEILCAKSDRFCKEFQGSSFSCKIIHFSVKIAGDLLFVVFQLKLFKRKVTISDVLQLNGSAV